MFRFLSCWVTENYPWCLVVGGGGGLKPQMGKHLLGGNEPSEHHPPSTAIRISQVFAFLNPSIIILPRTAISNFFILTHWTNLKTKQSIDFHEKWIQSEFIPIFILSLHLYPGKKATTPLYKLDFQSLLFIIVSLVFKT